MASRVRVIRAIVLGGVLGGAFGAVYVKLVRPWTMRWGATDQEVAQHLPGDDIVARPDFNATQAITIKARPDDVWPWLVQIGSGRAGWYSYDRIDNSGVPSASTVVPDLQRLGVGDLVPMVKGKEIGLIVKDMEPNRRMLWWDGKGEYTWEWVLAPIEDQSTRLVRRLRATYPPFFSTRMLYVALATSGDIVMVSRELRGIKERAERLARNRSLAQLNARVNAKELSP